ncbi:MAG: hypothetical protein K8R79_04930 [Calditrichales bacterium]|nr:hypothetical protein [Calditrichales bacterium]
MCINCKKLYLIITILLIFGKASFSGGSGITLNSGASLRLEPDNTTQFVSINILVDKTKLIDKSHTILFAEFLLDAIKKEFESLPGVTQLKPLQFIPQNPYNWMEQGVLVHKMKKQDFNKNISKILDIFTNKLKVGYNQSLDIVLEKNDFYADSLLWLNSNMFNPDSLYSCLDTLSRSRFKKYFSDNNVNEAINVWISGNYDPLDILTILKDKRKKIQENIVPVYQTKSFEKHLPDIIIDNPQYTLIRIPLKPVTPDMVIIREFLADHLNLYFLQNMPRSEIRFYYPWNANPAFLSIIIDKNKRDIFKADSLKQCILKLKSITNEQLKTWYYNIYLKKIKFIYTDADTRIIYKQLSEMYFGDCNAIFNVFIESKFPYERLRSALIKFIKNRKLAESGGRRAWSDVP